MDLTGVASDMPSSPWVQPIIQPHWPSEASVTAAVTGATNRGNIATLFQDYQGVLDTTRTSVLASLEGMTADAVRRKFEEASTQAADVTRKNGVKKTSYGKSGSALESLRSDLKQIAAEAESEINGILQSKKPAPVKVAEIVQAIQKHSLYATHKATNHGNVLTQAIQDVLTAQGDGRTVEQFAAAHGIPLDKPTVPTEENLRKYVEETMKRPQSESTPTPDQARPSTLHNREPTATNTTNNPGHSAQDPPSEARPAPLEHEMGPEQASIGPSTVSPTHYRSHGGDTNLPPTPTPAPAEFLPATATVDIPGGAPATIDTPNIDAPVTTSPSIPSTQNIVPTVSAPQTFGPQQLAESFTNGMQSGNPVSDGAQVLTHNVMDSAFRQPQTHSVDFTPVDSSPPTYASSGNHSFETAYSPTPSTPSPETSSTMYAAPVAPIASMAPIAPGTPAVPAAPVGPLPTYGSDIRPPAATAAPSPPPLASAPASAPVNPSAGASALNQQAVIRQPPTPPPGTHTPTGITENAVAAGTAGAVSGALAEQAVRTDRLHRLLESVARQEPRLSWAVGERDDGTTVLVTDLASGWIPPHVEIPTGVEILAPAVRRGGLEALVGDAALVETWIPGQYLPTGDNAEPVAMSLRSRDLPRVDDLNWELTQATNWRDGLPRLVHTLAKAGIAGTGVLDSETDLLREHLAAISERVLAAYPNTEIAEIGNWQLLAAIDALIDGRSATLNYHFAWFQALHMAPQGGGR